MLISILDQTPIRPGSNAVMALEESVNLAILADNLGYNRYWLSEHHNLSTLAGAAPEVMIARLASVTKRLRLGSGGIMLPNHSSLKVAENFRLLEAMFPGRIDLGIGRAPGGDRLTAQFLNPSNTFNPQDYIQQIRELFAFIYEESNEANANGKVKAIPSVDTAPELWMLTSSGESAYLAAHFGMALAFAKFINPHGAAEAIKAYKNRFKPGLNNKIPKTAVAIFAFCSDDEEKVHRVSTVMDYRLLHIATEGRNMPSFEIASRYQYSPAEKQQVLYNRDRMIIGKPGFVKNAFEKLMEETGADELIISTFTDIHEDRLENYRIISSMFGLASKKRNLELNEDIRQSKQAP